MTGKIVEFNEMRMIIEYQEVNAEIKKKKQVLRSNDFHLSTLPIQSRYLAEINTHRCA